MNEFLDARTQQYFEAMRSGMGYRGANAGWYTIKELLAKSNIETEIESVTKYEGHADTSEIEIFKYTIDGNIRYCAEFSYPTAPDDYCIETIIFDRIPSEDDIETITKIAHLELWMKVGKEKPEFTCWECERVTHWLDVKGDLFEKYNRLHDGHCGC